MKYLNTLHNIKFATAALMIAGSTLLASCGGNQQQQEEQREDSIENTRKNRPLPQNYQMPVRMDSLRGNLERKMRQVFNDSNHFQLAHAEYMGIQPTDTYDELEAQMHMLTRIDGTRAYKLDSLTHSVPYLVPEAARLLDDISLAFQDSLRRRGLAPVRLKVTSLLRTRQSVKSLRRVNRNATQNSTHQYGTTFDISYRGYYNTNDTEVYDPRYRLALAEVLYDLRAANRCMVKYEVKSPCFHITVIK